MSCSMYEVDHEKATISIVIPTYGRPEYLERTLRNIFDSKIVAIVDKVHIIDNDSSSKYNCQKIACEFGEKISYTRNRSNVGIEGNIINALFLAETDYVWMLSDHAVPGSGANWILSDLVSGRIKTDICCMCPVGLDLYAKEELFQETPRPLDDLSWKEFGQTVFMLSNISTIIIRKSILNDIWRQIYRMSSTSYPHLGILAQDKLRYVAVKNGVSFLQRSTGRYLLSYDIFKSRFIGFPNAVRVASKWQGRSSFLSRSAAVNFAPNVKSYAVELLAHLSGHQRQISVIALAAAAIRQAAFLLPLSMIGMIFALIPCRLRIWAFRTIWGKCVTVKIRSAIEQYEHHEINAKLND